MVANYHGVRNPTHVFRKSSLGSLIPSHFPRPSSRIPEVMFCMLKVKVGKTKKLEERRVIICNTMG